MNFPITIVGESTVLLVTSLEQGPAGPPGPPGAQGESLVGVAGAALSGHRLVAVDGAGAMVYATGPDAIGLTLNAAAVGGNVTVQQGGFLSEPSWSWIPGQPVFQVGAGQLTQTIPTTGMLRQVAVALSPTKIALDLQPPTILI
jgi:hypothetical protein